MRELAQRVAICAQRRAVKLFSYKRCQNIKHSSSLPIYELKLHNSKKKKKTNTKSKMTMNNLDSGCISTKVRVSNYDPQKTTPPVFINFLWAFWASSKPGPFNYLGHRILLSYLEQIICLSIVIELCTLKYTDN